jgi:hypothetical protein
LGQRLSDLERQAEEPSEEQSHLVDEMEVIREAIRSHPRCLPRVQSHLVDEIEAALHTDEAGNQHAITPGR